MSAWRSFGNVPGTSLRAMPVWFRLIGIGSRGKAVQPRLVAVYRQEGKLDLSDLQYLAVDEATENREGLIGTWPVLFLHFFNDTCVHSSNATMANYNFGVP